MVENRYCIGRIEDFIGTKKCEESPDPNIHRRVMKDVVNRTTDVNLNVVLCFEFLLSKPKHHWGNDSRIKIRKKYLCFHEAS